MNRLTMLATPDGRWVLEDSAEFLSALGDPNPDYDAAAFAVKNLGFIKFQVLGDSLVEIELHPRNVELPPLLAVQQQVSSSRANLFRVKYLDSEWHSEISSSAEQTISRLSVLCTGAFQPPYTDRYLVEPQDFSRLFSNEANPFRPMAQKWRASFGQFDETVIPFAIRHHLLSRLMIVGVNPRAREPVFRFIGDGFRWIGSEYHFNGIGEKVADQPDKEYGEWVSNFYKSVAGSRQPRHDLVTAVLHWEDEPGKPQRILHYERMLLPWRTASDEIFVTLSSGVLRNELASDAAPSSSDNSVIIKLARSS